MRYIFGDYTLDTECYELRHSGKPILLRPKAFRMLAYLLAHRDRVVTKDELLDDLWPNQFISDATLNSCLMAVRKAVGDSGQTQQIIQTLRGRGYRVVADVETRHRLPREGETLPVTVEAEADVQATTEKAIHKAGEPVFAGEFKSVTVLCCTVAEATALAMRVGPEIMHCLMQAFFTLAQDVVQRYAGTLTQVTGEGFTALFGAPIAQEDHPWRAVFAALDLCRQLRDDPIVDGQFQDAAVSVCMGLHTGSVVVGGLEHEPQRIYTAIGETTYVASSLLHLAKPDTLLVSEATYRAIQNDVQATFCGTLNVPQVSLSMPIYTVHGATRWRAGGCGRVERPLSRFVGRERELSMLRERLAHVKNSQGQVVGIVGDPGIGKSRLLYEFRRQVAGREAIYREGRCLSYGSAIPYLPVRDMLRQICGVTDTDAAELITTKVNAFIQQAGTTSEEWLPYLHQLLGSPEGTETLARLSPEAIRTRTFAALRQLCLKYSQQRPLVIVIEDLQWLDKTSEAFLTSFVESIAGACILFLSTYRSGYRPPWIEKSYATQLALQPLAQRDSLRMVQSIYKGAQIPEDLLQVLLTKAEGNPFFLEELARAVMQPHDIRTTKTVPDNIQNVLMARIDALPGMAKQLLQTASILGREVPLNLLQAIWEGPGDLDDHILELQRLEFFYEQVGTDESIYLFKHALTQEVAYTSMLLTRRQALHGAVGRALETLYADHLDDVLARLAYHYTKSSDAVSALTYLNRFATKAARNYAHAEAVTALQNALDHVKQLPAGEQMHRVLKLCLRQAFSLSILGRFQDILDLLLPQQEPLEHLQEPSLTGPYYFRLGMTYIYLGDYEQAAQHAHRAIEAARLCQDVTTLGMAYYMLAFERYSSGRFQEGVAYSRQAIDFLQNTQERHWLGLAHWIMGNNAGFLGDFKAALDALAQARTIGESMGEPRLQSLADGITGWIYTMQGAWDAGIEICQHNLERSPDPVNTALALMFLGTAYLEKRQPNQAMPLLERAIRHFEQFHFQQGQGRCMPLLGEALLLDGALDRAQERTLQGLRISQDAKYLYGIGLAQRTLGLIAQTRGAFADAFRHLHEALETFTSIQARYEVGRTYLTLAELAQTQENRDALTTSLNEAYHLFKTLRLPSYVERTKRVATASDVPLVSEPVH